MQRFAKLVITFGGLLPPCLFAAQAPGYAVSGPTLGLVADPAASSIRPILGIPGAATWGAPLAVDFATVRTAVAPGGDFALLVAREDYRLAIVRAAGGAAEWLQVEPAGAAPDTVSFSPRGRSVALYYRTARRLVVLNGMRDGTVQASEVDMAELPDPVGLLAVSEDGLSLLAAIQEGDSTAVYHLSAAPAPRQAGLTAESTDENSATPAAIPAGTPARRLAVFGTVSALEFVGESLDALVADAGANAVYLMRDASGAAQTVLLGSERDGLSKPVSVKVLDGRRVLVANGASGNITILYRDGASPSSIPCDCSLAGLSPLGGAVFRLTEPSAEPLLLLDAGGVEPRIVVVPPESVPSAPGPVEQGGVR
jgi:hypothetical protein